MCVLRNREENLPKYIYRTYHGLIYIFFFGWKKKTEYIFIYFHQLIVNGILPYVNCHVRFTINQTNAARANRVKLHSSVDRFIFDF